MILVFSNSLLPIANFLELDTTRPVFIFRKSSFSPSGVLSLLLNNVVQSMLSFFFW